jgi:hypothetical protein
LLSWRGAPCADYANALIRLLYKGNQQNTASTGMPNDDFPGFRLGMPFIEKDSGQRIIEHGDRLLER